MKDFISYLLLFWLGINQIILMGKVLLMEERILFVLVLVVLISILSFLQLYDFLYKRFKK